MAGTTVLVSMVDVVGHRRSIFIIYFNVFVETRSGSKPRARISPTWMKSTYIARQVKSSCTRRINTCLNFWEKAVIYHGFDILVGIWISPHVTILHLDPCFEKKNSFISLFFSSYIFFTFHKVVHEHIFHHYFTFGSTYSFFFELL